MGQHGIPTMIDALNARVDLVAGLSDDAEEALDVRVLAAEADIAAAESAIAVNAAAISGNTTNIATNASAIAATAATVATHGTSISTNTTNIATNTSAISANTTGLANAKSGADNFTAIQVTEIRDTSGTPTKVVAIGRGAGTPVNYFNLINSGTGSAPTIGVGGTDTDIDINLEPKGAGDCVLGGSGARYIEGSVPVAISSEQTQANSTAILLADLVTDFNSLLAKLRTSRVLDT